MESLPPALLDRLLGELSTLASVYHKPPEQFVGQGRYGADAVQRAAIEEQMENARENPLAAAAAAAAVQGKAPDTSNNMENLLDIDFDGAAPASAIEKPTDGLSGLEGLAGTPQRVASPTVSQPAAANNMDDLLGVFGNGGSSTIPASSGFGGMSDNDILNGFGAMDLSQSQPPPPKQQLASAGGNSASEDLLSL
jgi:hypothetical protein